MWNRAEIKLRGKEVFKANYWRSVLASLILMVLVGGSVSTTLSNSQDAGDDNANQGVNEMTESFNNLSPEDKTAAGLVLAGILGIILVVCSISFIIKIFVFNPLQVGCYGFFRENAAGRHPDLSILKSGFNNYGHTFITLFLKDLFLILWTLLFIVPGLIKSYSYRMVPFILRDNPDMPPKEIITRSRKMMDGHKWNTFIFDLSYIGWFLLGIVTLNVVNILWTEPYRQNANGALYLKLLGEEIHEPLYHGTEGE